MQKLYIKVDEENNSINHPHVLENMVQLYPEHNFNSGPPSSWMEFERVECPNIEPYQKFDESKGPDGLQYAIIDGKYKDTWHVLSMTEEEKIEKQNSVKAQWAENGFASWTFNEETCSFDPPTEKPDGGYRWDEETTSWVEVT